MIAEKAVMHAVMHTAAQADTSSISNYQEANLPSQCEKVECMHSQ